MFQRAMMSRMASVTFLAVSFSIAHVSVGMSRWVPVSYMPVRMSARASLHPFPCALRPGWGVGEITLLR